MKALIKIICLVLFLTACGRSYVTVPDTPHGEIFPNVQRPADAQQGTDISWGTYGLEIGRDGTSVEITPLRTAEVYYGYHLNVLKMLESEPCSDCLAVSNVHALPNGDISMDVSLTHPFSTEQKYCTGFDVRGIIMFPGTQLIPDDELRVQAGLPPKNFDNPLFKLSLYENGEAELMNADGYTSMWHPNPERYKPNLDLGEGLPIFDYYEGKYASGEDIATVNGYKWFYSLEDRHIFEAGQTVIRTYIIRPPATGPIQAVYAIYAHWAPPVNTPVVDPVTDFPIEANTPGPNNFVVEQLGILDPNVSGQEPENAVLFHISFWDNHPNDWNLCTYDLLSGGSASFPLIGYPEAGEDVYVCEDELDIPYHNYLYLEEADTSTMPGTWPYVAKITVDNFVDHGPGIPGHFAREYYLFRIEFGEYYGD